MICNNCGEEMGDAEICQNCGSQINAEENNDNMTENYEEVNNETKIEEEPDDETITQEIIPIENDKDNDTIFCTNCGKEITEKVTFCPNCGANLESPQPKTNPGNNTKFCQNCGSEIDENAMVCPQCGVSTKHKDSNKSAALAFILNFLFGWIIPGIGQIYLGLTTKGIMLIAAYWISAILLGVSFILIFAIIGIVLVPLFGILMGVIYIYTLVDAILSGQRIENGEFVEDSLFGFSF